MGLSCSFMGEWGGSTVEMLISNRGSQKAS